MAIFQMKCFRNKESFLEYNEVIKYGWGDQIYHKAQLNTV